MRVFGKTGTIRRGSRVFRVDENRYVVNTSVLLYVWVDAPLLLAPSRPPQVLYSYVWQYQLYFVPLLVKLIVNVWPRQGLSIPMIAYIFVTARRHVVDVWFAHLFRSRHGCGRHIAGLYRPSQSFRICCEFWQWLPDNQPPGLGDQWLP